MSEVELLAIGVTLLTPIYVYLFKTYKVLNNLEIRIQNCKYCTKATQALKGVDYEA